MSTRATLGCAVLNCPRPRRGREWCATHYQRWRLYGDPLGLKPDGRIALARDKRASIAAQVGERDRSACWTGGFTVFNQHGYPVVGDDVVGHLALLADGRPRPDGLVMCHSCDNPECWNPAHLRWDTQAANVADMYARGRARPPRGEAAPSAKLTEAQVQSIRSRVARGEGQRALAREFGVNSSTINRIVKGAKWKHV